MPCLSRRGLILPNTANVGALDDALSLYYLESLISLHGGGKSKIKHFSEERADEKLSHFYYCMCLSVIVPAVTERESVIVATTESC